MFDPLSVMLVTLCCMLLVIFVPLSIRVVFRKKSNNGSK